MEAAIFMAQTLIDSNLVADVCDEEFDCLPPHPRYGDVIAVIEDGEIKAFMSREILIHVGTVWVNKKDRGSSKAAKWLKELIKQVIVELPEASSALVIDETEKYGNLLERIGFYEKTGKTYRMDLKN